MELTIHTGFAGDETVVHVDWFDHNNVPHKDTVLIAVRQQDKPRMVDIRVNDVLVATLLSRREGQRSHVQNGADFEPSLDDVRAAERMMADIETEQYAERLTVFYKELLKRNMPDDLAKKLVVASVRG